MRTNYRAPLAITLLLGTMLLAAMLLPATSAFTPGGVATGLRRLADRFGRPLIAYVRAEGYLAPRDLASLIEDTANLLSQNAAPSVELTCLIDPQFPALVMGDPTRVRQIVSNLLSNALKFTDGGAITIGYALQPDNMLEFGFSG